jgi:hypothetical protein
VALYIAERGFVKYTVKKHTRGSVSVASEGMEIVFEGDEDVKSKEININRQINKPVKIKPTRNPKMIRVEIEGHGEVDL